MSAVQELTVTVFSLAVESV